MTILIFVIFLILVEKCGNEKRKLKKGAGSASRSAMG
jgi:hypothetical protein